MDTVNFKNSLCDTLGTVQNEVNQHTYRAAAGGLALIVQQICASLIPIPDSEQFQGVVSLLGV